MQAPRQRPREGGGRHRHEPDSAALRGTFRWIERYTSGFHSAIGVFLLLGFVIVVAAAAVLALIARWIRTDTAQGVDNTVLRWLDASRTGRLDFIMMEITALGSGTVVGLMLLVAGTFLWLTRHRYSAVLLGIAVSGGAVLNVILKYFFERPRPDVFEWLTHATHTSFPSGHATNAVVLYGTLAYLIGRLEPTLQLRRITRAFALLLILLIGLSRPYLGVHYPTDVIAGFIIGAAWAMVCALGIEAVRFFQERQPEIERVEKDLDRDSPVAT
ncbi:hypothetical protein BH23GEM3_BH23GEM3_12670 [soil metagenome]|nr:phosphatase PAP2 family protein [Gemmatimonadota bacterium]